MSEAVFPLLGPLLVFTVVLPLSAAVTKLLLAIVDRLDGSGELHTHQGTRYVLLVASSGAPLAWFFSASLHQAETGRSTSVCAVGHTLDAFCPEAAFFALALVLCAALLALPRLLREQLALPSSPSARARAAAVRVLAVVRARPALSRLVGRIDVRDDLAVPVATVGIARPRVLARTSLVETLDDDALAAALHHELEHVSSRDPLRYFVVWWALAVNPIGRFLLDKELARWLLAREVHCDRDAVLDGAHAPALAQAIVTAARRAAPYPVASLGSNDAGALKLRVSLLLAYAERAPGRCGQRQPALRLLCCFLFVVVVLPHRGATHALDVLHAATEGAVAVITGN